MGIKTVAVFSEADKDLPFVMEADEAYCIGKGPVRESYLLVDEILNVAKKTKAEAIHPGYGLLSENGNFARRILENGLTFIGPSPETIDIMGDKISARQLMKNSGVQVLPGSEKEVATVEEAIKKAEEIGYPVMLKASGGGGGIGMLICHSSEQVKKSYASIKTRSKSYFGTDSVFVEKYLENARHIEVQVISDSNGNYVHLFERDCSVQRRNQKVIEETHSPFLSKETRNRMYLAALKAARAVQYVNAGTIEFIVDEQEEFYFLEMNTRLQVEHPITEAVTGVDLVEWQIRIANGEALPSLQEEILHQGHSIEFRIYAENPKNFLPSPGLIQKLNWGEGDVRIDAGYREGNQVTPFYDPLLAKCIFTGKNRKECLSKAFRFFKTTEVEGIQTNIELFLQLLENPAFLSGKYSTNLLKNRR